MPRTDLALRDLTSHADYETCVTLQRATWGDDFRELVPPAMLLVAQKVGGLLAGAFEPDGTLAGFVFGLTGVRNRRPVHWSHMLAVRSDRRDRGIGRTLKEHQRARMRAAGVDAILWTFDPLVARNAHLNLERLGARAVEFVEDMYGLNPMSVTDSVIGSDRFVVEWEVGTATAGTAPRPTHSVVPAPAPVFDPADPADDADLPDTEAVAVPVPADIQALKAENPELAFRWRQATRRAFGHYLGRGYRVAGFEREVEGGGRYVVVRG